MPPDDNPRDDQPLNRAEYQKAMGFTLADLLRHAGAVPLDGGHELLPGHRYLLVLNQEKVTAPMARALQKDVAEKGLDVMVLLMPSADALGVFDIGGGASAHYAFSNSSLICAECGWAISGGYSNHSVRPFDYIVVCLNQSCSHYHIRYRVRPAQGIRLERMKDEPGPGTAAAEKS